MQKEIKTVKLKELSFVEKLVALRTMISVKKTGYNSFGKYSYYEIDGIYNSIKYVLGELGLFTSFTLKMLPDTLKTEYRTYITVDIYKNEKQKAVFDTFYMYRATMTITDGTNEKEFVVDSPFNSMDGASFAQMAGANVTYQAKYCYSLFAMLDDGLTDPDKTNKHGEEEVKTANKATNDDLNKVMVLAKEKGLSSNDIKSKINAKPYNVKSGLDLTKEQVKQLIDEIGKIKVPEKEVKK